MSTDNATGTSVSVWKGGAIFEHVSPTGVSYYTDAALGGAHNPIGPTPMEAVLGALTGCTGVDFVSILEKMRLRIISLRAETSCERASDHPRVYTRIHTDYWLETDPVDMRRALRALGLAAGKYCSVSSMLISAAEISYTLHYGGEEHGGVIRDPKMAGQVEADQAEAVPIPITDALDLHTIPPRDVRGVVEEYLREAAREGLREVRIIHGKGIGFQRDVVARVLEVHPLVESFHQASADRGHWGATVAYLRQAPSS